jgi:hypothetical protein
LHDCTINEIFTPQIRILEPTNDSKDIGNLVCWGLGWGLQKITDKLSFWHWGDTKGFKSYIAGSINGKCIVIFTNGDNGLKVIPKIIQDIMGMHHPAFDILDKI